MLVHAAREPGDEGIHNFAVIFCMAAGFMEGDVKRLLKKCPASQIRRHSKTMLKFLQQRCPEVVCSLSLSALYGEGAD